MYWERVDENTAIQSEMDENDKTEGASTLCNNRRTLLKDPIDSHFFTSNDSFQ